MLTINNNVNAAELRTITTPAASTVGANRATRMAMDATPIAGNVNTPVLERVARREPQAFEDCMRQYQPLLTFLIRKSFGTSPAARADFDDAMQEVCLAIWEAATKFDPTRGTESSFISMVARRRMIDRYHRRRSRINVGGFTSEAMNDLADKRDHTIDEQALPETIRAELAALDPDNRHLLELAVIHGKSTTQIAQFMGMRINTVKTRVHRALNRLRSCSVGERLAA